MAETGLIVTSALTVGLLGGFHCIAMCGGIVNALSFSLQAQGPGARTLLVLNFHLGRILSYTLAGALLGGMSGVLQRHSIILVEVSRMLAGIMIILMGLYLSGWWRGLAQVERLGHFLLWRHVQHFTARLQPVRHGWQALLFGALWGWLPCGLVYSTLTLAVVEGGWWQSALTMACFGLGTLPILVLTGALSIGLKKYVVQSQLRVGAAILVMVFGAWTLAAPFTGGTHHGHVHLSVK